MSTRETIERYLAGISKGSGWDEFLSSRVSFTSYTSPVKRVAGKAAFLTATQRFYATVASVEVREFLVDGNRACAFTRYELNGPAGKIVSDVAELFVVNENKIDSLEIYFDSAPFAKPAA